MPIVTVWVVLLLGVADTRLLYAEADTSVSEQISAIVKAMVYELKTDFRDSRFCKAFLRDFKKQKKIEQHPACSSG